jgi:hypothetical protein
MGKEVGHVLGEISEDEISAGRSMLSSVAGSVHRPEQNREQMTSSLCGCTGRHPQLNIATSIAPRFLPNRQPIEHLAIELPPGHEAVHHGDEPGVVGRLEQVHQLVNDDLFEALRRLLRELRIKANRRRLTVAASPLGLHPLHEEPLQFDAHQRLPFQNQRWHGLLDLLPIPFLDESLPFAPNRSGTHSQKHAAVFQLDRGWLIALADFEQIALAPHVQAFPLHVLARRFALLLPQLRLLLFDSIQLGNGEDADRVNLHALRG